LALAYPQFVVEVPV